MEKSISNAFTFMFKDPDWVYKLGILLMLHAAPGICLAFNFPESLDLQTHSLSLFVSTISQFLIPSIILYMILYPFIMGYVSKSTQNVIKTTKNEPVFLPNWEDNFFSYFIIGIQKSFAIFLLSLLLIPGMILLCIPVLIYGFIALALDNIFCSDFKVISYFKWGKAFKIVSSNVGLYIIIFIIALFLGLSVIFVQNLHTFFKMSNIFIVFFQSAFSIYTLLVMAYLTGMIGINKEYEIPELAQAY